MTKMCFLETNVLAAMGIIGVFKIGNKKEEIRHKFYEEVKELLQILRKNRKIGITSSTVVTEISLKLQKIIGDVISEYKLSHKEEWVSIEKRYMLAKIIHEIFLQSTKNFEEIFSFITIPSYDFRKSEKIKENVLYFLLRYYNKYVKMKKKKGKKPASPPGERDAKILSDAIVIFEEKKKELKELDFYFVTMDTFFTDFPDVEAFYEKFGFNSFWPKGDLLKLIG